MQLKELLQSNQVTLSFEVFPPKSNDTYDAVSAATLEIAAMGPAFMSVTYGAGGSNSKNTLAIAENILKTYGVDTMAHLTCVGSSRDSIHAQLEEMKQRGIHNIMALRGDKPEGYDDSTAELHYAAELVRMIREFDPMFSVGGACYPEGHVESRNKKEDIAFLKEKVDAGCDFLTTQMFFENDILFNFLYRIREKGISVPVLPGIMPVTNAKQMKRILSLSGTVLPYRFKMLLDRFGDSPKAMKQAGIAYAVDQIIDLIANGVNHIHVYSMNKPEIAKGILDGLSEIQKIGG